MRRKIIPHGPSTLTVSLPSTWVKKYNLVKGGEIDVFETSDGLNIVPIEFSRDSKECLFRFDNVDSKFRKDILIALHKKGYDKIDLHFTDSQLAKLICSDISELQLGLVVTEQYANRMLIRNISSPDKSQFDELFRRIFWLSIEYGSRIYEMMNNKDDMTETYLNHENSIRDMSSHCKRIIIKEGTSNGILDYSIISNIEMLVNNLSYLFDQFKEDGDFGGIALFEKYLNLYKRIHKLKFDFSLVEYNSIKASINNLETSISDRYLVSISKACNDILDSILIEQI